VLLFEPAFNKTVLDPGYIKGYLPGIRENGGQYTHPALWVIQAFAQLGDADRALEVFDLINPIRHAATPAACERYQVEPYVVAADVYGVPPHVGRGGWSWYTGSAAWMYRVAIESLLGFRLEGNRLQIEPCVPASWPQFEITYRWRTSVYNITVLSPGTLGEGRQIKLDGELLTTRYLQLADDGQRHRVVIGPETESADTVPEHEQILSGQHS
jgi:cellobiose phosphorylase